MPGEPDPLETIRSLPHLFQLPDGSRLGLRTNLQFDSNLELIFRKENGTAASIHVEALFHLNGRKFYSPISTPTRLNPEKLVTPISFTEIGRSDGRNPNFEKSL